MWPLILFLGMCSLHWTSEGMIIRNSLNIDITKKDGNKKSLVSVNSIHNPEDERVINVSALELDTIEDEAFSKLKAVESLNLESNKLTTLNLSIFSNLPNLTEISVAHNNIAEIHGSPIGSPNLKYLNLSGNNMIDLERSHINNLPTSIEIIMGKSRLQLGELSSSPCDVLEKGLQIHSWLKYIEMGKMYRRKRLNSCGEGQPIFIELCKTEDGTVESVKVIAKDEVHENCVSIDASQSITDVDLSQYELTKFRRGWFQVPDVFKAVDLSGNNFSEITPELLNDLPPFIEVVRLQYTHITAIRKNIIENRFLKAIDMKSNDLTTIEAGAFKKTKLQSLHSTQGFLTSMEFVRTLPSTLRYLNLNINKIAQIPENCFMNLKALEVLEIEGNHLTQLPVNTFRGLKELRYVSVAFNHLQKIEAGIFDDNEKLVGFVASGNSVVELEDGVFSNTEGVKMISLDENKITKISANTFSGLKNKDLYRLHLQSNKIDTIEKGSFVNMSIDHFDLSDNRITEKSIAKDAFESCKFGEVSPDLDTIGVEYTSLFKHHFFYGLPLEYESKGSYVVFRKERMLFISIPE